MNIDNVFKEFEKDVENHTLKILKEDGLYRHLRFSDGTSIYRFDIITWPGSLCISGDMGCQVFERSEDMFNFFRSDSKEIKINPSYWSEKSEAGTTLIEKLESVENSCYDLYEAVEAIRNIDNIYYDCFESIVFEDYTYRYIWRLFAIVWGIQKYDNYKNILSYV